MMQEVVQKINIAIIDDHTLIRETWAYLLENKKNKLNAEVVYASGNGEDFIDVVKKDRSLGIDLVLLDINMAPVNGLEVLSQLRRINKQIKTIIVSMHNQQAYCKKSLDTGARGYVTKNSSKEELFHAIREVIAGRIYICKEMAPLMEEAENTVSEVELANTELQILRLIMEGLSLIEIQGVLNISIAELEDHRASIFKKFRTKSTAGLVSTIISKNIQL